MGWIKTGKRIGKWILGGMSGILVLLTFILLIIAFSSSGKEEPILDARGKKLPNSVSMILDTVINRARQRLTIRGSARNHPVLLRIHGEHDHNIETSVAKSYFYSLQAPLKKWYLFVGTGHIAHFENPMKYRSIVEQEVLKN